MSSPRSCATGNAPSAARSKKARGEWDAERGGHRGAVSAEDIAAVVSGWTGIPVTSLTESESERLLHMEDVLHRRVIGQNEAVAAVARAIRRGRVGLKDPHRPVRELSLSRPHGCRQDGALPRACRGDVRRRERHGPRRYVRVYGKAYGIKAHRLAAGLRRL